MPRLLKDLQINDVSSVDRGAGEGVRVLLMKRDGDKTQPAAEKHENNVIDMRGLLLKSAADFDTALEVQESREEANSLMDELNEAICALSCSVNSIMYDEEVTDKSAAVAESFDQFKTHLEGLAPEGMEKAMTTPTLAEITKQIEEAVKKVAEPMQAEIAKLADENAFLKLSVDEQEFAKAMTPEQKKAFAAKAKDMRDKEMSDAKKAALVQIDPAIQKRLDKADEDAKVLKGLVEKDEISTFAKRAIELGLTEDKGEILRKAAKGDADAFKQVEEMLKALNSQLVAAQKSGKIFSEFGSQQSTTGKAFDVLKAKAEELRKTEAGKGMTAEQAFAKVYSDPANAEIAAQEKAERTPRAA